MKGMDFFKKMGEKGGKGGSSSIFSKMTIKGPSTNKDKAEQEPKHPDSVTSDRHSSESEKVQKKAPTKDYETDSHKEEKPYEIPTSDHTREQVSQPVIPQSSSHEQHVGEEEDDAVVPYEIPEYGDSIAKEQNHSVITQIDTRPNPHKKHKQSASESGHNIEKKVRQRKESNPFLSNIRKNTAATNPKDLTKEQQDSLETDKQDKNQFALRNKKSDKDLLLEQLHNSHVKSIDFIIKQKELKDSIIDMSGSIKDFKEQLSQSTRKQCQYVEQEEYELAENEQNKIDNLQIKINELEEELKNRENEFYQNQYDQLKFLKENHVENKKMLRKIKMVEMQLLEESSNVKRKLAEFEENEMVKIDNENKKITRLENDIKFQSDQLSSYEKEYQDDLYAKRNPLNQKLKASEAEKKKLEDEIKELEEQLAKKKKSLKDVTIKLSGTKKQIQEVEETFREEGVKLQQRKKKFQALKSEKIAIEKSVEVQRNKLNSEKHSMQKTAEGLEAEAKNLGTLYFKIEESASNFDDNLENKKVKVDNFIHNTKILKDFEQKHKAENEKIKQLEFKKANLAAEANKLEEKRSQLKQAIPRLESEQKAMAAAKNFKAAGMKKTEIKEAQDEINAVGKQVERCFIDEKKIEEEISKIQKEQMKFVDEENEIRKNLALSQFRFNIFKLEEMREEKDWANETTNEQVKQEYLRILEQEIDNITEEIKYIGEEYELDLSFLKAQKKVQTKVEAKIETKAEIKTQKKISQKKVADQVEPRPEQKQVEPEVQRQQEQAEELEEQKEDEGEVQSGEQKVQIPDYANQEAEPQDTAAHEDALHNVEQGSQENDRADAEQPENEDEQQDAGYVPLQLD